VVVVVVVVVGAGVLVLGRSGAPKYQIAYAEPEAVSTTVSAVGTLTPSTQSVIVPPINGTVSSITVKAGQEVAAGETLAVVSPSAQASQAKVSDASALAQAEAALAQAEQPKANFNTKTGNSGTIQSDINALRQTIAGICPKTQSSVSSTCHALSSELGQLSSQLSTKSSTTGSANSQTDGTSSATIAADEAIVAADQSALASAQQITSSDMVSPISGTVATLPLSIGQVVRAQSTSNAITVIQSNNPEVVVPIPISTVQHLRLGQQATITPIGSTHRTTGHIVLIGTTPSTDQTTGVTTVSVTLSADHLSLPIFDGAQALVTIEVAKSSHVLAVPTSAITYSGGHPTVLVAGTSGPIVHAVKVGIIGTRYTSLLQGINKGAPVILAILDRPLPAPVKPIGAHGKAFGKGRKVGARHTG
jgi:multidrug efflux pump subunit AcrA (membrane-fusion protein)